eukprot:9585876-Ditylum_brightwellii.AAC.1
MSWCCQVNAHRAALATHAKRLNRQPIPGQFEKVGLNLNPYKDAMTLENLAVEQHIVRLAICPSLWKEKIQGHLIITSTSN